jgi:hypothetical protein
MVAAAVTVEDLAEVTLAASVLVPWAATSMAPVWAAASDVDTVAIVAMAVTRLVTVMYTATGARTARLMGGSTALNGRTSVTDAAIPMRWARGYVERTIS